MVAFVQSLEESVPVEGVYEPMSSVVFMMLFKIEPQDVSDRAARENASAAKKVESFFIL